METKKETLEETKKRLHSNRTKLWNLKNYHIPFMQAELHLSDKLVEVLMNKTKQAIVELEGKVIKLNQKIQNS